MNATLKQRYLKGVFAVGLALGLSALYLPASANEIRVKDGGALRLDVDESDSKEIAALSTRRLQQHFEKAALLLDNDNPTELRSHIRVSRELVGALRALMPYMQVMDLLHTIRSDYANARHDLVAQDIRLMSKKANDLRQYMPDTADELLRQLHQLENDAKNGQSDGVRTTTDTVLSIIAHTSEENVLNDLDNYCGKIEQMLEEPSLRKADIRNIIADSQALLSRVSIT